MDPRARKILWFDAGAGALGGLVFVGLREWLAALYALPVGLVLFIGLANLTYASYSTTLATLASKGRTLPRAAILWLVIANASWGWVCFVLFLSHWRTATVFGLTHLGLEGVFVGILAIVEYRFVLRR